MLVFGVMACVRASAGAAMNPDKPNGAEPVQLRAVPLLQKPISGEFRNPKAQDLVDLVRNETGQRISLDPSVIQDRPIQGDTKLSKVPAWAVLENLARNQYIKGRWLKEGEEYLLIPSYSGSPPPMPPQLSPQLRDAMERARKGIPPDPQPDTGPEDTGARRFWMVVLSAFLLAALCIAIFWPRKAGARFASVEIRKKEKGR